MNKTVIVSVAIITLGITMIAGLYICLYASKTETRDRFTVCIDTVMLRSNEAGKPISAGEAKDICLQTERF